MFVRIVRDSTFWGYFNLSGDSGALSKARNLGENVFANWLVTHSASTAKNIGKIRSIDGR
ncbi:MAG: hypothetical protein DHS20C04_04210 [Hyphococcus sp.]|nr:MAG: hypothetical protein DHS20C04_04210 [Marinicaulis sp.]